MKKYYQVNFHAETHYLQNEVDDKHFLKGVSVSFSKNKTNNVAINTNVWIDKQVLKKETIEIEKDVFTEKFNQAIEILKNKL